MLSRDNRWRVGAEWLMRVLSMGLLAVLLLRALRPDRLNAVTAHESSASLPQALVRWTRSAPAAANVALDSVPTPEQRDWLAALARSGTRLTWTGPGIVPSALVLSRAVDPAGISNMAIAAPSGRRAVLRDQLGAFDTVTAGRGGIRISLPGSAGLAGASVNGTTVWAAQGDSVILKRLLVEGSAGWEMKFTVAALEERGWQVDALTHVAPGIDVRAGAPAPPDTARYAAIIAVDTSAMLIANRASAFVRNGGGLVTLRDAASIGPIIAAGAVPVVLERRGDGEVRAYRSGNGRVIRIGYKDLWRRRLTEDDTLPDPPAAHRAWLAQVVASVAYAPIIDLAKSARNDPAPLASLVDGLGPQSRVQPAASTSRNATVPSSVLFAVLMASLLIEVASRRLRGVK